jgi:hypothetical protein
MQPQRLITPAQMIERGVVTQERIRELLEQVRSTATRLADAFPSATFGMDADDILQVEAPAEDAAEIDELLQDSLTAFTPFFIKVRK